MKKGRVVVIACLAFLLLAMTVFPNATVAQDSQERYEERHYQVYDQQNGMWRCEFVVILRVQEPIRERDQASCRGELQIRGIEPGSELLIEGYQWEVSTVDMDHTFSGGDDISHTLSNNGERYDTKLNLDELPSDYEGRVDIWLAFYYSFKYNGQYIVNNLEANTWTYDVYAERDIGIKSPIPDMPIEAFFGIVIGLSIIAVLGVVVFRQRKKLQTIPLTPIVTNPAGSPEATLAFSDASFVPGLVSSKRGYETAGQYLKVGIKVENNSPQSITDVSVKLETPQALEKINPKTGIIDLGVIKPGGSQSANFQLQPIRCVDDILTGIIMFRDPTGKLYTQDMKPLELKSVCPMLTGEDADQEWILMSLKKGKLKSNKASFKFDGDPNVAFAMAEQRVRGLIPIDRDERFVGEHGDHYIAYSAYIGRTKYGEFDFATEITASGYAGQGLLTVAVYSNEEAILTGFIFEVMQDVKKNIEITQEIDVVDKACPECGGMLDMDKVDEEGYIKCGFCDTMLRVPKWQR
ncbi:hypothetical protein [Candidatus Borrarchaeum sp.]|uniref:hypothetical protein n=1 Tax=Candidatus Borrarchaeum sp. TaxID=2846742 RepID=UPI00257C7486|nr:hypothetical protein [Candidatus Borrarchaeum sp.]